MAIQEDSLKGIFQQLSFKKSCHGRLGDLNKQKKNLF